MLWDGMANWGEHHPEFPVFLCPTLYVQKTIALIYPAVWSVWFVFNREANATSCPNTVCTEVVWLIPMYSGALLSRIYTIEEFISVLLKVVLFI